MAATGAIVGVLVVLGVAGAALAYSVHKYGWAATMERIRRCPAATVACFRSSGAAYAALEGQIGRRRAGTGLSFDQIQFLRFVEPTGHKISMVYPSTWTVQRSENSNSSLIVQITCDSTEESYKRVSIAWDDVSWSPLTAEAFGRNMADQLPSLVSNSDLISQGPYAPRAGSDAAYEIVYRITDPVDGSQLQLLNVVIVAGYSLGRRRAYTLTFGCDADAYGEVLPLARHIVNSFTIEGEAGGTAALARAGAGGAHASSRSLDDSIEEDTHVNVWNRGQAGGSLAGIAAAAAAAGPADGVPPVKLLCKGAIVETPADATKITWSMGTLPLAGFNYSYPASWLCAGLGQDESMGFAPLATTRTTARRWCIAHACDRRESSYKFLSVVCVDLTPLYEVIQARQAKNANALEGRDAGTLLLSYLCYRYRNEVAADVAIEAGRPPPPTSLITGEDFLRSWVDLFNQRWPVTCRLATACSITNAAETMTPRHTKISDQRAVATSRLLKVEGYIRTGSCPLNVDGAGSGASGGAAAGGSPMGARGVGGQRRASTHSTLSFDQDGTPVEGLLIPTTSAVLVGLHDATVSMRTAVTGAAAASGAAVTTQKRVFGHVVTFGTGSDQFVALEGLAKHLFQSLHAVP